LWRMPCSITPSMTTFLTRWSGRWGPAPSRPASLPRPRLRVVRRWPSTIGVGTARAVIDAERGGAHRRRQLPAGAQRVWHGAAAAGRDQGTRAPGRTITKTTRSCLLCECGGSCAVEWRDVSGYAGSVVCVWGGRGCVAFLYYGNDDAFRHRQTDPAQFPYKRPLTPCLPPQRLLRPQPPRRPRPADVRCAGGRRPRPGPSVSAPQ
jgi:hypothetical protein